jgi:hypothetical protein
MKVSSRQALVDAWPAREEVSRDIYEYLHDGGVLVQVPIDIGRDICGAVIGPSNRENYGLIANIEAETGPGGAILLTDGASVRETHSVARKLKSAEERLIAARFGTVNDDVDELRRVVDTLEERVSGRKQMETSFTKHWVPKSVISLVVEVEANGEAESDGPGGQSSLSQHETQSKGGVLNDAA